MKCYLERADAVLALKKMSNFYSQLVGLYSSNGFNLKDNLGRRNILMSQPQEAFFALALQRNFPLTENNGATGEPDIYIPELKRELECKLTSRHRSGAISFQSDYETLQKKGKLDYLYVVASEDFDEFAVVHYRDLTVADFRSPSPGSRGKVQLKKHAAADRATVLMGTIENISSRHVKRIQGELKSKKTVKQRQRLVKSLNFWKNSSPRYSIDTETVHAAS
jgi:hypothetical protein|tara:strand:+ start:243 stop:908 length:666 start_codon:yes stop_codon:yes gene_type:complete